MIVKSVKRLLSTAAVVISIAAAIFLLTGRHPEPKVSIFADHINAIARQEGVSFADAARIIREIGYSGADVWITQDPRQLKSLDSLGFEHACCITMIDYCSGEDVSEAEEKTLDFMRTNKYDKVLVVPGVYQDENRPDVTVRLAAFAAKAAKEGLTIMVEDYDDKRSPCFNTEMLSGLFAASPQLMHNFDSGNYIVAGENCLEAVNIFRDRIAHVHLKDRVSETDLSCPAIGSGCIPEAGVISALFEAGYKGWLTVEHFGAPDMLHAARDSYNYLKSIGARTFLDAIKEENWL